MLDVGCNAGFYSLEMKRRGAARVLGIDSQRNLIRQAEFVRDVNGLEIDYRKMSVYDLDPYAIGQFDVTLALGLLYHCKHLVLALEKLFVVTRELLFSRRPSIHRKSRRLLLLTKSADSSRCCTRSLMLRTSPTLKRPSTIGFCPGSKRSAHSSETLASTTSKSFPERKAIAP